VAADPWGARVADDPERTTVAAHPKWAKVARVAVAGERAAVGDGDPK